MKYIYLFWWRRTTYNVGDEASPYIVSKLSYLPIKRKEIPTDPYTELLNMLRSIRHFKCPSLKGFFNSIFDRENFIVGLGSVICYSNKHAVIWGSGMGSPFDKFKAKEIKAVRGKETSKELINRGYPKCEIYGDPGLLMPLFYQPIVRKRYKIGIIPHIREYKQVLEMIKIKDYHVINMETDKVEEVVNEILSCEYVLSSSLHGLIFSHAYGIPALFFSFVHKGEGLFKYYDYFSSVGIDYYQPFDLVELLDFSEADLVRLFENEKLKASIQTDLIKIQRQIIEVAPFPVKMEYSVSLIDGTIRKEIEYLVNNYGKQNNNFI